jgi:dihydrofolate reductase
VSKVLLDMSVSLDRFVAGPNGEDGGLHNWFLSPAGGEAVAESVRNTGRSCWADRPTTRVTGWTASRAAPTPWSAASSPTENAGEGGEGGDDVHLRHEGAESAVELAKEVVGDRDVAVGAASIAQQCIRAGLLDDVHVNLAPVLLGGASGCSSTWGRRR